MNISDRHAYLIIAHANPYVLEKLLLMLDDERNDIFIHIDKKTKGFNFDHYQSLVKKSTLLFIDRIDVRWGHVSQIKVELELFKAAYAKDNYTYYHLISGADLPIQRQDVIHDFFDKNKGKEFIGFSDDHFDLERVNKIHLFPKHMRVDASDIWKRPLRKLRKIFLAVQRSVGYVYGTDLDVKFVQGANWVSITNNLVGELLKQEKEFLDFYKYSNCCDEVYKQTFVYNNPIFREKVCDLKDELKSNMRFMDWQRGRPYTFRSEDFDLIVNSGMLFARKFEDNVDVQIVDLIYDHVMTQK